MTSAFAMYRTLVGVGVVCGLLIVVVYELTLPIIEANRAEALQDAIFTVLPEAQTTATFVWTGDGFEPAGDAQRQQLERLHAAYDRAGKMVGVAIEARGMGYQDVIGLLYGYSVADQAIVGMAVLESRETPGLGDKIEKDPAFLKNFERLDVTGTWQIDTITGATISSIAVRDILKSSTSQWMPRIAKQGQF